MIFFNESEQLKIYIIRPASNVRRSPRDKQHVGPRPFKQFVTPLFCKMKVPELSTVQLVAGDSLDLSNVVVSVTVTTGRRNARSVYFPKTDATGRAQLHREDFVGQFADATESDLMGSWGSLDDASSVVQVQLYDPAPALSASELSLAWPLLAHEQQKWASRAAEYAYRRSCRNLEFAAEPITIDLRATTYIELHVVARSAG